MRLLQHLDHRFSLRRGWMTEKASEKVEDFKRIIPIVPFLPGGGRGGDNHSNIGIILTGVVGWGAMDPKP